MKNKKRYLLGGALILSVLGVTVPTITLNSNESTNVVSNNVSYTIKNTLQSSVDKLDVTTIDNYSPRDFAIKDYTLTKAGNHILKQKVVQVPWGVTKLGASVFQYDRVLQTIYLPDTLQTIDSYVFRGCTGLENLYFYDKNGNITSKSNLNHIGRWAFQDCISIKTLDFSNTKLNTIYVGAFYNNKSLQHFKFPSTITLVGTRAFEYCISLLEVDLSMAKNFVWRMPEKAFKDCKSIRVVYLPPYIAGLDFGTFWNNISLTKIYHRGTRPLLGYQALGVSGITNEKYVEWIRY